MNSPAPAGTKAFSIRPFEDADYDAIASVISATRPIWQATGAELLHEDRSADPKYYMRRLVAEMDGEIVAQAYYGHFRMRFDPRRFLLDIGVVESARGCRIGSELFDAAMNDLAPFDPSGIRSSVSEDDDAALRFAEKRGFSEIARQWESSLEVSPEMLAQFKDRLDVLAPARLAIKAYSELADDPERDRKLYDLEMAVCADMPDPEPFTPLSFEEYRKSVLEGPQFLPDACFVLLDGDRYAGISNLFLRETDNNLYVNATGLLREYRGRGLAFALKVRALQFAVERGHRRIYTDNSTTNAPMIAINRKLGFEKLPGEILLRKNFGRGDR